MNERRVLHNLAMSSDLLLQLFPEPVLVLNAEHQVQQWNPAAAAWSGIAGEDALGRPLTQLLDLPAGARSSALHPGSAREPGEVLLAGRAAPHRPRRFRTVPVPVERGGGVILIAEEPSTTAARAAQRTLSEQQARADAEREELQQAAIRRDRFFSAMSHDLRTPITAVMGYSELLMDDIMGEITEEQREMVGRISQASHHLAQMLTNLLDIAKLDAGRMQFTSTAIPLAATTRDVVAATHEQIEHRESNIVLDLAGLEGQVATADETRVRQVLGTLVANALRHTERGTVSVRGDVENGTVRIAVRDAGPPLPVGGEEAAFEEFHRSPPGSVEQRGTGGLELPIARRLARAMGGNLTVSSTAEGAIFVFLLPLRPSE